MKWKWLPLLLLAAAPTVAQPITDTIQDTIYDLSGRLYVGPLTITLSTKKASCNNSPVVAVTTTLYVTAGNLNVALAPNDCIVPARTSYTLAWANGAWTKCSFPTSSTPLKLGPYCTDTPPSPASLTPTIPLSWLGSGGLSVGQLVGLNTLGNSLAPVSRGGYSIMWLQPTVGDSGLPQKTEDGFSYAISEISCSTDQGTAQINLDVRAAATPNASGSYILSTPLSCTTTTSISPVVPPVLVLAGSPVALDILSVSGSPGIVRVHVSR